MKPRVEAQSQTPPSALTAMVIALPPAPRADATVATVAVAAVWNRGIQYHYARVLALIGSCTAERVNRKERHQLLKDAARAIPNFTVFRQLCSADLRETWAYQHANKVRVVHNRCDTWKRVYAHWHKLYGTADHGPFAIIRAVDDTGTYSVKTGWKDPANSDTLWGRLEKLCADITVLPEMVAEFRRKCEAEISARPVQSAQSLPSDNAKE